MEASLTTNCDSSNFSSEVAWLNASIDLIIGKFLEIG